MKIVVLGATGLIGSHLVERLIKEGHDVYAASRGNNIFNRKVIERICEFTPLDLRDLDKTTAYMKRVSPDTVYLLSANAAEAKGQFSPIDMTNRNMVLAMTSIVACIRANVKRIIFTSSSAVYGTLNAPFKEIDDPKPQDIYGINKFAIEKSLRVLSAVHGFEYVIARPHNVYGPQQDMTDMYRNVVTLFMNHLLKREPYAIYGDGSMKRCFSYIDDVIDVLVKMSYENVSGMTFNVGADQMYSIQELSDMIQKVTDRHIPPKYILDRPQEVHEVRCDHTLQKTLFGYADTPLEEGIKRTWAWANMLGPQDYTPSTLEIESQKTPQNWKK